MKNHSRENIKNSADDLRNELRNEPYASIKSWKDGLEFAGKDYLDKLDEEMLMKIKNKLNVVISTGPEKVLRSHYEDEIYP